MLLSLCDVSYTVRSGSGFLILLFLTWIIGRSAEGYQLRYNGCEQHVIVRSTLQHELSKHVSYVLGLCCHGSPFCWRCSLCLLCFAFVSIACGVFRVRGLT